MLHAVKAAEALNWKNQASPTNIKRTFLAKMLCFLFCVEVACWVAAFFGVEIWGSRYMIKEDGQLAFLKAIYYRSLDSKEDEK